MYRHMADLPQGTLRNHLVERIREAIISGNFKPGERLNETHIATEFKVSRIPVREALLQLQEQGLVMNHPRRGMFVISLSDDDVQRINSLRILLEAEALKLCRAHLTATIEKKLTHFVDEMEKWNSESDIDASNLDLQFHRTIWSNTGNPYLEKSLNSIVILLFAHQALGFINHRGPSHWPLNHHRALLDVVLGTSSLTPEAAMIQHLRVRNTNPERFSSLALQYAPVP